MKFQLVGGVKELINSHVFELSDNILVDTVFGVGGEPISVFAFQVCVP